MRGATRHFSWPLLELALILRDLSENIAPSPQLSAYLTYLTLQTYLAYLTYLTCQTCT